MKTISQFFFDLFLLGYVEDPVTGVSVSIPGGMSWVFYVEVPSQIGYEEPTKSLDQFIHDIPALGLVGNPTEIDKNTLYKVDDEVQLVCKYLKAYLDYKESGKESTGINRLYKEGRLWCMI